ncbi:MAG: ethanolamine utilization microcompartment protein EutL [Pseudomonadota bacterium]
MILEPIKPEVPAYRIIPAVHPALARELKLADHHRSVGLLTCSIDDCLYAALDHGTKHAPVEVVYAKSFYAGSAHASGPFSGEIIGIFAGEEPESVSTAMQAALRYLRDEAWFYAADEASACAFFPHVIPSVGHYLAAAAGCAVGSPMAYLIAPPLEAQLGLDAALKAAEVELKVYYPPPSETNFSGGLLIGDLPAVQAAAQAFQETVLDLAARPHSLSPLPEVETLAATFGRAVQAPGARFRLHGSGLAVPAKPPGYTHLFDDTSLVRKTHPAIRLRGRFDLLQAHTLDAAAVALRLGRGDVVAALSEVLAWLRALLAAEVTGRPVPELAIAGLSAEELHRVSHDTTGYLGVGWVLPEPGMGELVSKLNLLRATCREAEIAAEEHLPASGHVRADDQALMTHGLNRLSNAVYVLVCREIARAG